MRNKTYRGMPKPMGKAGWYNESMRHSLASKGIKTTTIPQGQIGYTPNQIKQAKKEDETYARSTRPLMSYTGGKTKLTKTLLKKMPPHKTYVEPFVGGASVFFSKPPAEKSVINDKDQEVMQFYKAFADIDVNAFNKLDFTPSKTKFERLKESNPKSNIGKVEKLLYMNKNSFMGNRKNFAPKAKAGRLKSIAPKVEHYIERLDKATKLNQDFGSVIKKYDSPNTFFYLDPPYYEVQAGYKHNSVTPEQVANSLKGVKGKFMLSYNVHPKVKTTFKNYNQQYVTTAYPYASGGGHGAKKKELLITNYKTR